MERMLIMSSAPKIDALETFLTGTAQSTGTSPSAGDDTSFPGKVVILTILSLQTQPTSRKELGERSELKSYEFERTLDYLLQMHLIEKHDDAFQLTDAGRRAAAQERDRLLRFG
jgi:hypothetical protein